MTYQEFLDRRKDILLTESVRKVRQYLAEARKYAEWGEAAGENGETWAKLSEVWRGMADEAWQNYLDLKNDVYYEQAKEMLRKNKQPND